MHLHTPLSELSYPVVLELTGFLTPFFDFYIDVPSVKVDKHTVGPAFLTCRADLHCYVVNTFSVGYSLTFYG